MAATNNKHLAYRYGYCVNEKCEKSKKDTKGKPQVLQIASHKPLVCPDCQKPLHECPPPKPPTNILKWILIGLLVLLLLGGAGFGIYKLLKPIGPKAIKLAQKELVMKVGETQVIVPTAEPEGVKATFIFKKKGKNVEVTSGGEITALKKGEATILIKCEENPDIRAICKVTVKDGDTLPPPPEQLVKQLSIDGGDFSIKVGESKQLTFVVVPEKHDELLSWTSDNETVATVDNTGKVSAIKKGTATIKVAADKSGVIASVKVTVTKEPGGDVVDPRPISPIERYGKYSGGRAKSNGYPDGTGKLTFTKSYQLNAQYTAQPGEYIQGIFENGKPTFVTYYQKDGTVTKIKLR